MCQCQNHSSSGCGCQSKNCSCPCCKTGCGCQSSNSCSSHGSGGGCDYAAKFLDLADQAWMEVLKEKIKDQIKSNAKNMDELAHLIAEANHERWHKKIENKQSTGCYEEKLKNFFTQSCHTQCQKK